MVLRRNFSNTVSDAVLTTSTMSAATTTVNIDSGGSWPAAPFTALAEAEVLLVTTIGGGASTAWTVTRGFDSTTPDVHAIGTNVRHVAVAADYEGLADFGLAHLTLTDTWLTSEDALSYGGRSSCVDGNWNTGYWTCNAGTSPKWVLLDLQTTHLVGEVSVWFYQDTRQWKDVKLEVSVDGATWVVMVDRTGANTIGYGVGVYATFPRGMTLRYVRVWVNGSTSDTNTHLNEIRVMEYTEAV